MVWIVLMNIKNKHVHKSVYLTIQSLSHYTSVCQRHSYTCHRVNPNENIGLIFRVIKVMHVDNTQRKQA